MRRKYDNIEAEIRAPQKTVQTMEQRRARYCQEWEKANGQTPSDTEAQINAAKNLSVHILQCGRHALNEDNISGDHQDIFASAFAASAEHDYVMLNNIIATMKEISTSIKKSAMDRSVTQADLVIHYAEDACSKLRRFRMN